MVEEISLSRCESLETNVVRDQFCFSVNRSAMSGDPADFGDLLWCTAIRQLEVFKVKRIIPELMDFELNLNNTNDHTGALTRVQNIKMCSTYVHLFRQHHVFTTRPFNVCTPNV